MKMVIFHSYVSLPEGRTCRTKIPKKHHSSPTDFKRLKVRSAFPRQEVQRDEGSMPSPLQAGQICGGGMFFRRFPREMGKSHGKVGQNWWKMMEVSEIVNVFRPFKMDLII